MKKHLFRFLLVLLAALATACTKEGWKDDVEALQKPAPTDIVILDVSAVTAVKGTSFELRLRVNPSGVEVTRESLELDLRNSDTYLRYDPTGQPVAAAQSKASYVTPSDHYEIVGVEADRNAAGEPLDGQWVVTVATRGEGNFRNVADLYFVVNYTDAAGAARKVSSPGLPVQIVPTADEGLELRYSLVQNFRTGDGKLNPYMLYVDVNAYRNAAGEVWYYDRRFVSPSAGIDGGALGMDASLLYDKYYISFTPDEGNALWADLEAGQAEKATTEVQVTLTDFGGTEKTLSLPVTYCPRRIVLRREVPIAELNANRDDTDYYIDLGADAARYGLTADLASRLARVSQFGEFDAGEVSDVVIDEVETEGPDHSFVVHAYPFIGTALSTGFTTPVDKAARLTYSLTSFPQELSPAENARVLLDVDIRIVIEGVQ